MMIPVPILDASGMPVPGMYNMQEVQVLVSRSTCIHLGKWTGELVECHTCKGKVQLKIISCDIHGKCTVAKQIPETACCSTCPDHRTF